MVAVDRFVVFVVFVVVVFVVVVIEWRLDHPNIVPQLDTERTTVGGHRRNKSREDVDVVTVADVAMISFQTRLRFTKKEEEEEPIDNNNYRILERKEGRKDDGEICWSPDEHHHTRQKFSWMCILFVGGGGLSRCFGKKIPSPSPWW